ncbi:MAG: hypothetical protein KDK26_04845 [Roseivivax sp.]|nr:hypothetical protein [Roseivivax sp.]
MTLQSEQDAKRLADALESLAEHRFVRMHNSTRHLLWFQFLRGMAFGFGTAVGASLMVSGVVLFLSQFEFIPVIGQLTTRIIEEIELRR